MQKSIIYYNTSWNGGNWVKSISNLNFENKIEVSAPHRDQKQMVALKKFKLFLANASFWKFTEKLADIWSSNEIKYTPISHIQEFFLLQHLILASYLSIFISLSCPGAEIVSVTLQSF